MMDNRYRAVLLGITLLLLLSGCISFEIVNVSEVDIRVMIRTPDSSGAYTRHIAPGGSASSFSSHGGGYSITALPNAEYEQSLKTIQAEISRRLFEERATLTASDVAYLVQILEDIDRNLDQWGDDAGSCSGTAPDFSAVTALIAWSVEQEKWEISCNVASDAE